MSPVEAMPWPFSPPIPTAKSTVAIVLLLCFAAALTFPSIYGQFKPPAWFAVLVDGSQIMGNKITLQALTGDCRNAMAIQPKIAKQAKTGTTSAETALKRCKEKK